MNKEIKDLVIVGAGPSALTAAIYTTREEISTALCEKGVVGGLAAITDWIDNYPGFSDGIKGMDLASQMQGQAERFGAEFVYAEVTGVSDNGKHKVIETTDGKISARSVLLATGSAYRKLDIPGEEEFYGRGVHFCATCDGAFYRGKNVAVVGGGNSAVQEALFLLRFAKHIDLLVRSEVKASEVLQRELEEKCKEGKVTVHLGITPTEIVGQDNKVTKILAKQKGEQKQIIIDGVFVFIGLTPNTSFLEGSKVKLDERGFIKTDQNLQTNIPGVFASGDVRSGATMQIASAAGEGATAALKIREYLDKIKHQEFVPPTECV